MASSTGARSPGEEFMTCKHLSHRRLSLQSLSLLGKQAGVLDSNDGLPGEVDNQIDLIVVEGRTSAA